jgi:shikimate dehydrogenase
MKRLGVLGWPVAHSRSPAMHNAAFRALGMTDWHYQRLPVPPEVFTETVKALRGSGFVGANVTIPHKEAALALADEASDAAREIGAANTLELREDGSIRASNTDAPGLLEALPRDPRGATALVLGAGGSARACLWALREAGAARVAVWNRTAERARALAEELGVDQVDRPEPADILVNCTSVGLSDGRFKDLPLDADSLGRYEIVVDLVYRSGGTELIARAREHGCSVVDGLEILVRQGALSFATWTDRQPPIEVMREAARGSVSGRQGLGQLPSTPDGGSLSGPGDG